MWTHPAVPMTADAFTLPGVSKRLMLRLLAVAGSIAPCPVLMVNAGAGSDTCISSCTALGASGAMLSDICSNSWIASLSSLVYSLLSRYRFWSERIPIIIYRIAYSGKYKCTYLTASFTVRARDRGELVNRCGIVRGTVGMASACSIGAEEESMETSGNDLYRS